MAGENGVNLAPLSEGEGGRKAPAAVGVEYLYLGKVKQARIAAPGSQGRAGSAVVMTAGALHTPKVRCFQPLMQGSASRPSLRALYQKALW